MSLCKDTIFKVSVRFVATLFLNISVLCIASFGQFPAYSTTQNASGCPTLRYLDDLDTVAQKASIDSALALSVGQWQLVEIRSNSLKKPTDSIVMSVTHEGKGKIFQNDKLKSIFQWNFKRGLDRIQFTIEEQGDLLFPSFRNRKNWLLVCTDQLELMSGRSDEITFVFKRNFAEGLPKK